MRLLRVALTVLLAAGIARADPLPPSLIALDTPEGERLLEESTAKADFYALIPHYETQEHQSYCGIASAVVVLNALPLTAPEVPDWAPYRAFTQVNIFGDDVRKVATPDVVKGGGLTLDALAHVFRAAGVTASALHASATTEDELRRTLIENLGRPNDYIVLNFKRDALGQEPPIAGHFSPLAAYNARADRFLVLDVARYRYPPFWVTADALWQSVDTLDPDSGLSRGVVLVSAGPDPHAGPPAPMKHRFVQILLGVAGGLFLLGALAGGLLMRFLARRKRVTAT
jgi:hypothetical protein